MNILNEGCNSEYNGNVYIDKKFNLRKTDIQIENTNVLNLFIKPCSVALTRLNLWDHKKETFDDNIEDSHKHQLNMTASQLIKGNKTKTLRCASIVNSTGARLNGTDFPEAKNCLHRTMCKTSYVFHKSKEKKLLNYKLPLGIYASNNFKRSDSVIYTQQNQSIKTHKDFLNANMNTFTNIDLEFSHSSRCKKFCVDGLNEENTEIVEENNQSLKETYSKILKLNKNDASIKRKISKRCNYTEIVKNIKPCSVLLSRLNLQVTEHSNDNPPNLIQNEGKDDKTYDANNDSKNVEISESTSNLISCSVSQKKESDHFKMVYNIAEELSKAIDDYFFEREKNGEQIRKPEPYFPKISQRTSIDKFLFPKKVIKIRKIHCDKCRILRKQMNKRRTLTELFGKQSVHLNSAKHLSKYEKNSNTNLTSEKSVENSEQDLRISKIIQNLKPCYVLICKLSLSELNRYGFLGSDIKTDVLGKKTKKICIHEKKTWLRNKGNHSANNELDSELKISFKKEHNVVSVLTKKGIHVNSKQNVKISIISLKENELACNIYNTLLKCSFNFKTSKFSKCCHVDLRRLNLDKYNLKFFLNKTQKYFRKNFINLSEPKDYVNVGKNVKLCKITYLSCVRNDTNKESCLYLSEKIICNTNQSKLSYLNASKNADKFYNNHAKLEMIKKCRKNIKIKTNSRKNHELVAQSIKTLNFLWQCKQSIFLPCGLRNMNISGKYINFETMSVAKIKKNMVNIMKRHFYSRKPPKIKYRKYCTCCVFRRPLCKKKCILFNCMLCNSSFTSQMACKNHSCVKKEGYLCDICEEICETPTELKLHIQDHLDYL